MIFSVAFSKPVSNVEEILGKPFVRIKVKKLATSDGDYFLQSFTKTQVFHKKISQSELLDFIENHAGKTFRACVILRDDGETQILANKKGKITRLEKKLKNQNVNFKNISQNDRQKRRILNEGEPIPFLVRLGIMSADGKVIAQKFDKFRQINRFLEIFSDVLGDVLKKREEKGDKTPLRILDFGSGKSYLTFAVHYFLSEIKKIDCEVFGLDLKADVIDFCSKMANEMNLSTLKFGVGDIATFSAFAPDIVITLHACDTATDYALSYAVKNGASAILSVPCCQHEINAQLSKSSATEMSAFEPLLRFGIIKERFSALATDALRAEILENAGYRVQILEFVDFENTPKNLLIRAVLDSQKTKSQNGASELMKTLGIKQTLFDLLEK